jgi:SCY1-like protein 2
VTASLSGLLAEKDDQERAGGVGGRSSRFVTEDSEGGRRRRELEIDELEIQKGLEQISKALEFLHDAAGLVHGNLTPDAIFVNAKVRRWPIITTYTLTYFDSLIGKYPD